MVSVAVMKDSDGYCTPFGTQPAAAATGPSNLIHIVVFRPA